MEQIPATESDVQKVIRIAKELSIGIEEAAVTCDAFHLAFSDNRMRRAIFEIIDELDDEAVRKGEPRGMIISYAVELGLEGIRVRRHANDIPPGQIVELTPRNRAMIFVKIKDNFPTQQFLGPLIVNRPELPSLVKEGWQTDVFCRDDGVVCSDEAKASAETDRFSDFPSLAKEGCPERRGGLSPDVSVNGPETEIPTDLPSHCPKTAIPLGPIRLKFSERFKFLSGHVSKSHRSGAVSRSSLAGLPVTRQPSLVTDHLVTCHLSLAASGLSPPPAVGESGTLRRERCPPQ